MAIFTGSSKLLGGTESTQKKETVFYGLVEKNVLITGANGQLGNELRRRQELSNNTLHFIYTDSDILDITNEEQVDDFVRENRIQYIINCAAYTAVDKAESDVEKAYLINSTGAENLAKAARNHGAKLIHISTDYVFDGKSQVPYSESMPTHPQSVYGASKVKGEEAIRQILSDAVIIRTSWLYSEFGNNFVKTMLRLMQERETLNIVSDQTGSPTYAADLAEMIIHIIEHSEAKEWKEGTYHFCNSGTTTWFGFAEKIKELAGITTCEMHPIRTDEYPTAAQRPAYSVMDTSKISSAFHVEIPSWENALQRCMGRLKMKSEK